MTISLIMVTFNRIDQVRKCFLHNTASAGDKWNELVWLDNGSSDGMIEFAESVNPDRLLVNGENLGVSKGYNMALASCTSDWICIMGDRNILPHRWLYTFKKIIETDDVDSICMYEYPGRLAGKERLYGKVQTIGGTRVIPALQNGSMIFRRFLLDTVGYWREDMGMYGWNDIEWGRRMAHRKIRGFVCADLYAKHLDDDPAKPYFVYGIPYREWVNAERDHPSKKEKLAWCEANNYPYYNPFK